MIKPDISIEFDNKANNISLIVFTLAIFTLIYFVLFYHDNNSAAPTIVDTKHKTGIIVTDQNDSILVDITLTRYTNSDSNNVSIELSGINCDIQVIK